MSVIRPQTEILPEKEWIILDVLRGIIKQRLPDYCKEKISYNVPFFYGNKLLDEAIEVDRRK